MYEKIIKILYYALIKKEQSDINVKETGAVTEKLYIEYADSLIEGNTTSSIIKGDMRMKNIKEIGDFL